MNQYSTIRRLLINASRLSQEEPLDYATQDIIFRTLLEALRAIDELDQQASVDNVLEFRLRESPANVSQFLASIVDASNN
jgi:hypothetical protein